MERVLMKNIVFFGANSNTNGNNIWQNGLHGESFVSNSDIVSRGLLVNDKLKEEITNRGMEFTFASKYGSYALGDGNLYKFGRFTINSLIVLLSNWLKSNIISFSLESVDSKTIKLSFTSLDKVHLTSSVVMGGLFKTGSLYYRTDLNEIRPHKSELQDYGIKDSSEYDELYTKIETSIRRLVLHIQRNVPFPIEFVEFTAQRSDVVGLNRFQSSHIFTGISCINVYNGFKVDKSGYALCLVF